MPMNSWQYNFFPKSSVERIRQPTSDIKPCILFIVCSIVRYPRVISLSCSSLRSSKSTDRVIRRSGFTLAAMALTPLALTHRGSDICFLIWREKKWFLICLWMQWSVDMVGVCRKWVCVRWWKLYRESLRPWRTMALYLVVLILCKFTSPEPYFRL